MPPEDLFARKEKMVQPLDRPHRVNFHSIIYITACEGTHQIDFHPYAFSEESLLFISRGQVHAFNVRPDIKGYLLLFTSDYPEKNLIHSDVVSIYRLYSCHLHTPIMQP